MMKRKRTEKKKRDRIERLKSFVLPGIVHPLMAHSPEFSAKREMVFCIAGDIHHFQITE